MTAAIEVEVALALPDEQFLVTVNLPPDATVAMAIDAAGLAAQAPGFDVSSAPVGIWGRRVALDDRVRQGDRVELYRSLAMDPREARRQLATIGRTMRQGAAGPAQSRGSSS